MIVFGNSVLQSEKTNQIVVSGRWKVQIILILETLLHLWKRHIASRKQLRSFFSDIIMLHQNLSRFVDVTIACVEIQQELWRFKVEWNQLIMSTAHLRHSYLLVCQRLRNDRMLFRTFPQCVDLRLIEATTLQSFAIVVRQVDIHFTSIFSRRAKPQDWSSPLIFYDQFICLFCLLCYIMNTDWKMTYLRAKNELALCNATKNFE